MTLQIHLNKSGSGMASTSACGRNILRTPLSTNWEGFKTETYRCIKCEESKQFAVNTRMDLAKWEPEADDAWMVQDDALMANPSNLRFWVRRSFQMTHDEVKKLSDAEVLEKYRAIPRKAPGL